ncbi:MAG TPA: hypothetical protein VI583_07300, partial [Cyclobacteriaceae bacterium]|nr:hypothetical protein [Cyclobacteriaceae bacterium]
MKSLILKFTTGIYLFTVSLFAISQPAPRVLAYYLGRPEEIDNYDVTKMTHIIFCFGQLNGNRFALRASDSTIVRKMVAMKSRN